MNLSLSIGQIIELVGGESPLNHSLIINNIASLETATNQDCAVVFDPEDGSVFAPLAQGVIERSHAGLIIASSPVVEGKNYLIVKDPLAALTMLFKHRAQQRKSRAAASVMTVTGAFVSPSVTIGQETEIAAGAVIEDGAVIGAHCSIGAQVFIGKDVQIGDHVLIHPGVKILDRTIIGSFCIIHPNAVIGSDGFGYRISRQGLLKIPHLGIVKIGNQVEIGANASIDRAAFDQTVIGDAVKIGNSVVISHNVKVGVGSVLLAHTVVAGSVVIGRGCQVGAQVAMKDHITVGDGCKVVSTSGVMRDLKPGEIVCGMPAVTFGDWKRMSVAAMRLPEMAKLAGELKPTLEKLNKKNWFQRMIGL